MMFRFYFLLILVSCLTNSINGQDFTQEDVASVIIDGIELSNPFGGGLNAPQLSNVDFNNDGVSDVLIFDRIGGVIMPMIRNGEEYTFDPSYTENFPVVAEFLLMKDYNDDGIADIFCYSTEPGVPGVSVYKGKYTNDKIDFDLFTYPNYQFQVLNFELSNGSFSNIAVLNTDIPSIEDIDGDGDMDIVTFNFLGGYVEYYQNLVVERGESLDGFYFSKMSDCYGGIYESGLTQEVSLPAFMGDCSEGFTGDEVSTRHAGSTLLSIDYDADGDFELLLGDLSFNNITLLENGGNSEDAFFNKQILHYPDEGAEPVDISIFPAAFYVDIDGDNVKDFVAAPNNINNSFDTDNVWYYRNAGTDNNPVLSRTSTGLFVNDMIDLGTASSPSFADVNADGLIDMVVGTETKFVPFGERDGRLHLFLNIGTATDPVFELVDENWLDFERFNSDAFDFTPTFADVDNDGDLDLYTGETNGHIYYGENIAGAGQPMNFAPIVPNYLELDVGKISTPTFFDLDDDGLLDLIVGERNGNINFHKNIGTSTNPNFNPDLESPDNIQELGQIDTRIPDVTIVGYSKPIIIPFEGSNVLITGTGHGALKMYLVDSDLNSEWTLLNDNLGNMNAGEQIIPNFIDLDNDGLYEAIVGNRRGGLTSYTTNMEDIPVSTTSTNTQLLIDLKSNLILDMLFIKDGLATDMIVYTALGQEVLSTQKANSLDVKHLDTGIYFIQLTRGNNRNTQIFIKK